MRIILFRRAKGIDSQSLTYVKPYCRIAPYLVGMLLGHIILHFKDWKMPKVTSLNIRTYMTYQITLACENSRHFVTPPLVSPRNDV